MEKQETEESNSSGILISTIEMKAKAYGYDGLEGFENGILPWINLDDPKFDLLIDPDKIVLPYPIATLIIDYPLKKAASFELKTIENGWTRIQLLEEIINRYRYVYKEEERITAIKGLPFKLDKKIPDTNQTESKYGIYGHVLSDLDLSSIEVYNSNGKIILCLTLDS